MAGGTQEGDGGGLWGDDYEDQWYEDRGGHGVTLLGEEEVSGEYDSEWGDAIEVSDDAWQVSRHADSCISRRRLCAEK